VDVRGNRITLSFRGKHKVQVRTTLVDDELAAAMRDLLAAQKGGRVFRFRVDGGPLCNLTSRHLNEYVKEHIGPDFTAKDFRTWGGTLLAAIACAERANREGVPQGKRGVAAVMRTVADQLGNTPAVCRASYVAPAVIEQYLDGRTIEDFRPRHLRIVAARQTGLDPEEIALVSLLRSYRIRQARAAA
jgi:DNA topoisomerase I